MKAKVKIKITSKDLLIINKLLENNWRIESRHHIADHLGIPLSEVNDFYKKVEELYNKRTLLHL